MKGMISMGTDEQQVREYNADFDNGKSTASNMLSLMLEQLQEIYLEAKSTDDIPEEVVLEFDLSKAHENISTIQSSVDEVANVILRILGCGISYEIKTVCISKTTMGSTDSEVQLFSTENSSYVSKVEYVISFTKSFMDRYTEFMKADPRDIEELILKHY